MLLEELVQDIDRMVGRRGRSGFIVRASLAELKRLRQLAALEKAAGSWSEQDHPELAKGADRWVSQLRKQIDKRLRKARQR